MSLASERLICEFAAMQYGFAAMQRSPFLGVSSLTWPPDRAAFFFVRNLGRTPSSG